MRIRCEELKIKLVFQGVGNKLKKLLDVLNGDLSQVAYFGDDVNDISCMERIQEEGGVAGCPSDATLKVKNMVDYVSGKSGGHGALREFIEWLIYET